jgi:hypothetical protein
MTIFNPDAEVTLSNGDKITVKLLNWKKALEFFGKLKTQFEQFISPAGELKFDQSKIMAAVMDSAEMMEWLVMQTTGKIDQAWLETLDLGDMVKLTTKAIEINLGTIAAEIKNVRGRLAAAANTGIEVTPKSNATSPDSAKP